MIELIRGADGGARCGAAALGGELAFSQVSLVRDGKACAVVVTSARPSPVAAYAAQELLSHVKRATGQQLPTAVESDIPDGYATRVYVGVTEAARRQAIDAETLAIEEYVLRTVGNDLFIVGKELYPEQYHGTRPTYSEPWNPLAMECVHSGTLLGVYEVLEDHLGVRGLWPGDLGTYVPRCDNVVVPAIDRLVKPRLLYRNLGGWDLPQIFLTGSYFGRKVPCDYRVGGLSAELVSKLVFPTEEAGYEYGLAVEIYNRRHRRVTQIEEPRIVLGSHVIAGVTDWWAKYGKEHPEWFAMRATASAVENTSRRCVVAAVRVESGAAVRDRQRVGRRRCIDSRRSGRGG